MRRHPHAIRNLRSPHGWFSQVFFSPTSSDESCGRVVVRFGCQNRPGNTCQLAKPPIPIHRRRRIPIDVARARHFHWWIVFAVGSNSRANDSTLHTSASNVRICSFNSGEQNLRAKSPLYSHCQFKGEHPTKCRFEIWAALKWAIDPVSSDSIQTIRIRRISRVCFNAIFITLGLF